MAWWKRDEGLKPNCTTKRSHVESGGKVVHFMVAIVYMKGVILCEQHEGRINEEKFANFVREHFEKTFVQILLESCFFRMVIRARTVKKLKKHWMQLEQDCFLYLPVGRT